MTPASVSAHHDTAEARGPLRYDGMEIAIADIGLFFAYPWPEERALMRQLFEAVARAGAMLVVYHTDTDIRVWRKVAGEGELEDPRRMAQTMTVLHHAFSARMASVPHRKSLSRGPEGKPTGTDERWCGQTMRGPAVRRWDGQVRPRSLCGPCAPEVPWSRMHGFSPETSRSAAS